MGKVKITVLKRHFDESLVEEYACDGFGKCHLHTEGQVFYADWRKPEGLCDDAWLTIHQYVFALTHGGGNFYQGKWINRPDVAICCCNDGLRPVVFKVERVEEEDKTER